MRFFSVALGSFWCIVVPSGVEKDRCGGQFGSMDMEGEACCDDISYPDWKEPWDMFISDPSIGWPEDWYDMSRTGFDLGDAATDVYG